MTRRAPLLAALAAVLLTVLWWYLLYQPKRVEHAAVVEETAQLETQRGELQAQIAVLREVEENERDYRSQLVRLTDYIPDDPGQPEALEALQEAADAAGVELSQTTFGDPELVEEAPEAIAAAPEEGEESLDPSTDAVDADDEPEEPDVVPDDADDADDVPDETAADDVATDDDVPPGYALARIPTQFTVDGGYFQVVDLLRRIEVDLARAVKVSSVTMAEEEEQSFPDLTVTVSGHIYAVLPVLDAGGENVEIVGPDGQPSEGASEGASEAAGEAASEPATTDGGTS